MTLVVALAAFCMALAALVFCEALWREQRRDRQQRTAEHRRRKTDR